MDILVSVIIITYCRPVQMLLRAVNSARHQTYSNLEIIVVDDSPATFAQRDAVQEAIQSLQDIRIVYLRHEKNMGACVARNTGIAAATGQYIMYLDDDDELLPDNIERRLHVFAENPDLGMVYSRYYIVDTAKGLQWEPKQELHSGRVFDRLILDNFIGAFPLIKSECFSACGMFDSSFQSAQDYDMWLRIASKYEVGYVDAPLSKVYCHSGERISTNNSKKVQGLEALNQKFVDYLEQHKKVYALRVLKLVNFYVFAGDRKTAWKKIVQSVKLNPLIMIEQGHLFWGTVCHLILGR